MGVSITGYSHLELAMETGEELPDEEQFQEADRNGWLFAMNDQCFAARMDGWKSGFYRTTRKTKEVWVCSVSYGTYGGWRDDLGRMVGASAFGFHGDCEGGPFAELICFSDCEGAIGPDTSKKLYKDFKKHAAQVRKFAKMHPDDEWYGGWYLSLYNGFRRAFKVASKSGLVLFH